MRISDWSSDVCSSDLADPRPSLVACNTTIGYGAPNKAGSHNVHGSPLGADEIAAAREHREWPHEAFLLPDEVAARSKEHTSELQSLMRISYAVVCLKKKHENQ